MDEKTTRTVYSGGPKKEEKSTGRYTATAAAPSIQGDKHIFYAIAGQPLLRNLFSPLIEYERVPMQLKWLATILAIAAFATSSCAQTSVSLSGFGSFTSTATDNGIAQTSADQIGGLLELRHIAGPLLGFEATYSLNRANQTYKTDLNDILCPPLGCTLSTESVSANAHEITADWVPSLRVGNFRPFGIAGGGILIVVPMSGGALAYVTSPCGSPNGTGPCPGSGPYTSASPSSTPTSTRAVYVYGAGVDWRWLPHLGMRLQYRGNVYQSPEVTTWFSSTRSFVMHTAEPMVGAYWNF